MCDSFLTKNRSTTSATSTNMESDKTITKIEAKKIDDSVLGKFLFFFEICIIDKNILWWYDENTYGYN